MAPRWHLITDDQFPFSISLVPRLRNPLLYRPTTARTRRPIIQGCEFWPARPIDEPLVHEFYANLETIHDQVTIRAFVRGIDFDLMLALITETLGIPREDQPGFPYALGTAPREAVLARALHRDRSRYALTQSGHHVSPTATNIIKDVEADATEDGGVVPDVDYLVDQMPLYLSTMTADLHSLIPDDEDDDDDDDDEDDDNDDDDDDDGDDRDFTLDTSTT
ncbi:hypothetical protein F0562_032364 [Nyssa sinensis]|uniref:Uncharacterized protein n=1 Tax=Nyssa sinensis TaxID=561372 RepID=A0A5J5ATS2_9ASTE|nr:hypothetical protein F0562_032364 [Nyssa sinensis]